MKFCSKVVVEEATEGIREVKEQTNRGRDEEIKTGEVGKMEEIKKGRKYLCRDDIQSTKQ